MKTLDEHNDEARRRRAEVGDHPRAGVACPKCGEELMVSNPGMFLASDPPLQTVHCPGCGLTGTKVVG
jgi:hypothetical protein